MVLLQEDDASDNYYAYEELSQKIHHRAARALESFGDNITYSCNTDGKLSCVIYILSFVYFCIERRRL